MRGTDILMPRNYLEVPALRMPDVFLILAEEARNSGRVDDRSADTKDVQPERNGLTERVFVTNTSDEMIPDRGLEEPVDRSDPVGPHSRTEQSVFLRLDADQGEHIPTTEVHPGVKMFRTQPVADGPAGSDRTRRPVGTVETYTAHDEVRPMAGGPVGRFLDPSPLESCKKSSPDDSHQPLVTGPVDTNEMDVINNPGRPTAGGPLGRPFSLDPMDPRVMSFLGDDCLLEFNVSLSQ